MHDLAQLSALESAGVVADVLAPLVARGVIVRRPAVENLFDRLDGDRRAVTRMQRVRDRHGPRPALLRLGPRVQALILDPEDVKAVLERSPDPFAADSREKRAALNHFQPHGVLVSHGPERAERRRFNEDVLDSSRPAHRFAEAFTAKVREEADAMIAAAGPTLGWDEFALGWWRAVRRVVLGDAGRDDHALTDMVHALRQDANWAFAKPRRAGLRERFERQLRGHVDRAEPDSLAQLVATAPATPVTDPLQQMPQWLFAFDAAGMAAFRALALVQGRDDGLDERAAILESVRLWPTSPAVLRDAKADAELPSGATIAAGTGVIVFAPFFHRDDARLPFADAYAPEQWRDGVADGWPLIPFSAGPVTCPGRNLVLLTAGTMLAALAPHLTREPLPERLPGTLSPFRLEFART